MSSTSASSLSTTIRRTTALPSRVREIAAREPRVEVRAHTVNRGHIATYNEGIDWAGADYFLLLSADDMAAPGAFARAIAIMEQNPSVVLTHGCEFDLVDDAALPAFDGAAAASWTISSGRAFIAELCRWAINRIKTSTTIVRGSAQKAVGHYRADLPHAGDLGCGCGWPRSAMSPRQLPSRASGAATATTCR